MNIKLKLTDTEWTPVRATKHFRMRCFWPSDKHAYAFEYGTIEGVYLLDRKNLDIFVVRNRQPHNGHFVHFLNALEKWANEQHRCVSFKCFTNVNLYHHICRRAGWRSPLGTMDWVKYTPQVALKDIAKPCIFCGKFPIITQISGIYYAQCSNCTKRPPYEFAGISRLTALKQWNIGNSTTGTQGAYRRKPNRMHK